MNLRGLTVTKIAQALGTNNRTVQRYLKTASGKAVAKLKIEKLD